MNFDNLRNFIMEKMVNIIVVTAFLLFILLIIVVSSMSSSFNGLNVNSKETSASEDSEVSKKLLKTFLVSANTLSNKKIEFGIKRADNHAQPDIGSENKKTIEKFNGIALGNPEKKYIYLTFDVGYEGGYTDKILDILKENNVPAAFFITGQFVKTSDQTIKRMIDEGHIVRKSHKISSIASIMF